jgi:exonuclease VII small subunit
MANTVNVKDWVALYTECDFHLKQMRKGYNTLLLEGDKRELDECIAAMRRYVHNSHPVKTYSVVAPQVVSVEPLVKCQTHLDKLERKLLLTADLDEWQRMSETAQGRILLEAVYHNW